MLASDLQRDAAIILMDSKGELTAPIRNLALGDRLIVLDPEHPFAINPLDVPKTDVRRAVSMLEYIFSVLLEANVTPMQKALLRSILRAVVIAFPEPTLQTIQDIITSGPAKYRPYIDKLPPDLHEFFNNEWRDYDRTRNELKWRFRLLLENDLIRQMFSAPKTRFHISEAMDRGDVVVIENTIDKLQSDGSAFLGRFFLTQIWGAAMARSPRPREQKKPVYVYIDEADLVIKEDPTVAAIIDRCRSQNIALICAMQRAAQITEPNVRSALENCAIKMANVGAEASYFSELLHIPKERMDLKRGFFAMHVRDEGSSIVEVPLAKLPYRQMTQSERQAHEQRMIDVYGCIEPHKGPEPPKREGSGGAPAAKKTRGQKASAQQKAPQPAEDPHTGEHTEPASKWGS